MDKSDLTSLQEKAVLVMQVAIQRGLELIPHEKDPKKIEQFLKIVKRFSENNKHLQK